MCQPCVGMGFAHWRHPMDQRIIEFFDMGSGSGLVFDDVDDLWHSIRLRLWQRLVSKNFLSINSRILCNLGCTWFVVHFCCLFPSRYSDGLEYSIKSVSLSCPSSVLFLRCRIPTEQLDGRNQIEISGCHLFLGFCFMACSSLYFHIPPNDSIFFSGPTIRHSNFDNHFECVFHEWLPICAYEPSRDSLFHGFFEQEIFFHRLLCQEHVHRIHHSEIPHCHWNVFVHSVIRGYQQLGWYRIH
mmetsp:Transcript_19827/g.40837  ORF Transcript_19827/g.40837 Transcript_19827/m.40837 type:complete len:242 (-) Transcript_19827:227-952(-)